MTYLLVTLFVVIAVGSFWLLWYLSEPAYILKPDGTLLYPNGTPVPEYDGNRQDFGQWKPYVPDQSNLTHP